MVLNEAVDLAKSKKHKEALPLFEKTYQTDRDSFNEWDLYFYSRALANVDKFDDAIKINQQVFKSHPEFEANIDLYGWNLYKHVLKKAADDEKRFFTAANFIIKHTKQGRYSAYERTVLEVLKFLKNKPNTDYQEQLKWTDLLDPKALTQDTFSFKDDRGKRRELASPLESWYQYRIKALFETKQYQSCIDLVQEALSSIKSFHYNNDFWFRIREAVSIARLGDVDDGIKRLHTISKEMKHWTVYNELFYLYKEMEAFEKAIEMGAFAFLERSGEFKHKIKLLLHMGDVLEKTRNPKLALMHYSFVVEIREGNEWSVNQEIENRIELLKQEFTIQGNLKHELISYWKKVKLNSLPKGTGMVKAILPNKKAGFITTENGEDLYFQVRNAKQHNIEINSKVSFFVINSYDQRKKRESKEAVEITVI